MKRTLPVVVLISFLPLLCAAAPRANTPHAAYGVVRYSDGSYPESLTFTGSIAGRPGEILSETSVGCGYDRDTGIWYIGVSNFASPWHIGDTLLVNLTDGRELRGSAEIVLSGAPADKAPDIVLQQQTVQVTVTSIPSGLPVLINDSLYVTPAVLHRLPGEEVDIGPDSLIHIQPGSRLYFSNWGDAGPRNRTVITPETEVFLTAYYHTQHFLEIISPYGTPRGQGWYDEGSAAMCTLTSPDTVSAGTRAVFQHWSGSGSGSYSGTNKNISLIVNNPISQTAAWDREHRLTVIIRPPGGGTVTAVPSGPWHSEGTQVQLTALAETAGSFHFVSWSGDFTGTGNPAGIRMDSPLTVTAVFSNNDLLKPEIAYIYPLPSSQSIAGNAQLMCRFTDPYPASGLDPGTFSAVLNNDTLISKGNITISGGSFSQSVPGRVDISLDLTGKTVPGVNTFRIRGGDWAAEPNFRDTTFTFFTSDVIIADKRISTIDHQGGTITIPGISGSGSSSVSVPYGALSEYCELVTGSILTPPALPEEAEALGSVVYLGPDGFMFSDSAVLQLPYSQDMLTRLQITHPLDIPVYRFSTVTGTWEEMKSFRFTNNSVYLKITRSGIYCLGSTHITGVSEEKKQAPLKNDFLLHANYPNPFNQHTVISFNLPAHAHTKLYIIDIRGRRTAVLADMPMSAGHHEIIWEGKTNAGRDAPSGIYICYLISGAYRAGRRLILSR